jgi:hypothetical protein
MTGDVNRDKGIVDSNMQHNNAKETERIFAFSWHRSKYVTLLTLLTF